MGAILHSYLLKALQRQTLKFARYRSLVFKIEHLILKNRTLKYIINVSSYVKTKTKARTKIHLNFI